MMAMQEETQAVYKIRCFHDGKLRAAFDTDAVITRIVSCIYECAGLCFISKKTILQIW